MLDVEEMFAEFDKLITDLRAAHAAPAAPMTAKPVAAAPSLATVAPTLVKPAAPIVYAPAAVIDTNHNVTNHLDDFIGKGVVTFARYFNPNYIDASGNLNPAASEKTMRPAEARAIGAAGKRVLLICEGFGDFAHGAISAAKGTHDGTAARLWVPKVGAPADGSAAVAFTVDTDASPIDTKRLVLPYFASIRQALAGSFKVAVYGSGAVCDAVMNAGLADIPWVSCSTGWSGTKQYLAAGKHAIQQHFLNRSSPLWPIHVDLDTNDVNPAWGKPIGDFVPFAKAT